MSADEARRSAQPFGATPFAPLAAPDFGGPRRFAENLAASLLRTRAMTLPADRIFADETDHVSITPQIDLRLAIVANTAKPDVVREGPTLEVLRERSHSDRIHVIERRDAPVAVESPIRLYEQLSTRFDRVEREVRQVPAFQPPAGRPAGVSAPGAAAPPATPAAMVLHHRQLPAPPQPAEVRRLLPSVVSPQSGGPAISSREISRVADEVISVLNRQSLAWRERFGRG